MKKSIFFFAIFFIGSLVFSCSEDKLELTKTELLLNKTWIVQSKIITPSVSMNGITISDINVLDSEDVRNYSYKFNSDGTLVLYNQLNVSLFQTNWSFNADETQIVFNPGIVYSYPIVGEISLTTVTIESITADKIISKNPYVYEATNYEITLTFIPK